MMETPTGESPEKIFLNSFGGFGITDREVNSSFEGKMESAFPKKSLSQSVILCSWCQDNH